MSPQAREALRDQIAIATLPHMQIRARGVDRLGEGNDDEFITLIADIAYRIADAMIERRKK